MSFLRFFYRLDYLYFWLKWKCKNFVEQKMNLFPNSSIMYLLKTHLTPTASQHLFPFGKKL